MTLPLDALAGIMILLSGVNEFDWLAPAMLFSLIKTPLGAWALLAEINR